MRVNEIMKRSPATCTTTDTVADAATLMHQRHCGFVPVVDSRRVVVGVLTDRDVCLVAGDAQRPLTHVSVGEAMSHPVFSCFGTENVKVTLGTMARRHVRRLPVLDKTGHLQGVLSIDDVAQAPSKRGSPSADEILAAWKGVVEPRPIELVPARIS